MVFYGFFLFLLGLIFGSFLNSLLFRIDAKPPLPKRSFCPKCKAKIAWYDNIPLLSYLLLGGKCRMCKKPISLRYPAIELITASLFLLIGLLSEPGVVVSSWLNKILNFQPAQIEIGQGDFLILNESINSNVGFPFLAIISLILLLVSCFLLLAIAIYDAKTKYVLSFYVYAAIFFSVTHNLVEYFRISPEWHVLDIFSYFIPFVLAGAIPAVIFLLASKLSKEKIMGAGDAEIALAMGLLLGWPNIVLAYYSAFFVGAIWGSYLLITKKAKLKSEVPFGPFLILGVFFSLLFGEQTVAWYGRMFLGV